MGKKVFFLFSVFVGLCMVVAWQFASVELADVQKDSEPIQEETNSELVENNNEFDKQ